MLNFLKVLKNLNCYAKSLQKWLKLFDFFLKILPLHLETFVLKLFNRFENTLRLRLDLCEKKERLQIKP